MTNVAPQNRRRDVAIGVLVVAWVGGLFWTFMPGLMSPDTLSQYGQGLSGMYSNAHPPMMSWVMGVFGKTVGSPWPFLLLDLSALAVGMGLLVRDARPAMRWWSLLLFVAFLLLPTTWSLGVVLWKDSALGGVLLLTVAALHHGRLRLALVLMLGSMLLRHNSAIAVAPFLVFATGKVPAFAASRARRLAALVGALAVLSAVPPVIERLSRAEDTCMLCMPALLDLSAVYIDSPELFPPSVFAADVSVADLKATYSPSTMIFILYGSDPAIHHVNPEFVVSHRKEILSEWLSVIPQRPWAYLKSRFRFFAYLLGLEGDVFYAFHTGIDANPWGLTVTHADSGLHKALRATQEAARNSLAFRGWFWLGLSSVFCVVLLFRRPGSLAVCTALSGFLFTFTLLLLAPSADFRYLFWTVMSCFATAALLLAQPEREPVLTPKPA